MHATDKLVLASQGVVDSSGQLAGDMNAARGSLVSEMAASVHAPVADWQQQFRLVTAQHKQLVKLASSYGKSEGSLEKATVKRSKATAAGAKDVRVCVPVCVRGCMRLCVCACLCVCMRSWVDWRVCCKKMHRKPLPRVAQSSPPPQPRHPFHCVTHRHAQEKQAKLQHSLEDKAQRHEMAKTAFVCTAPQVSADFKSLLRKRDELRVNLFAAFTVSARALSAVASLSPGGGGGKGGSDHPGRRSSKERRSQTAVQPFAQPLV